MKRKLVFCSTLVFFIVSMLFLTGCGSELQTEDRETNNELNVSEIINNEEANISNNLNDVEEFNENDLKIGGLSIDDGKNEIISIFGENYGEMTEHKPNTNEITSVYSYDKIGIEVKFTVSNNNPNGKIKSISCWGDYGTTTTRNLKIGSTVAEILSAYKSESIIENTVNNNKGYIIVGYPNSLAEDKSINYVIANGKIQSIAVLNSVEK